MKPLKKFADPFYALFRFVAGGLFIFHGTQKLLGWPGGKAVELASLRGLAGIIELVGGALIAVGLFTSIAAFLASGQMAVAYFMVHFSPEAFWPIQNKGELAALYCFAFLYIAARGGGKYSFDAKFRKR